MIKFRGLSLKNFAVIGFDISQGRTPENPAKADVKYNSPLA